MSREMKNSGIEWIGKIPSDWSISKLKYVASIIGGNGFPEYLQGEDTDEIPFYKAGDISAAVRKISDSRTYISRIIADKHRFNLIPSGAILMPKIGEAMKKNSRALSTKICCIDNNCQAIVPSNQVEQDYCYYLLCIVDMNDFDNAGTIPSLNNSKLLNLQIPFPPKKTQHAIANYLDSKCSQIDALIANTEAQIEELGEYKKALITQAVTKGLDPDVEMKDSGIEWIGKIPSHWSILRIANIYTERSETGCKDDLPILMVSINSGVSNGEVLDEERTRMVVRSEDKSLYKRVYPDDLVYNTMRAWQGAFGAVRVNGLVSPAYVTAAPKIDIDSRYIEYLLRTPPAKEEMKRYSYGIADFRMRLYWQYFKNISVALPPLDEQHHIASFIDSSYFKIDSVIKKNSELLETLQDYKKSLIYDYVTGKREVPVSYRKGGSHE